MNEIITTINESRETPNNLSLTRCIILASEFSAPSLRIENITEIYFFRMDFSGLSPLEYPMIQVSSDKSRKAPELWAYGPLSDITSEIKLGVIPEIEYELHLQLKSRNSSVSDYHPEIAHAKIIRQQFFAGVRELERAVLKICGTKLPKILGNDVKRYRREIETAPEVQGYQHLDHTQEYLDDLTTEFLSRNNLPPLETQ